MLGLGIGEISGSMLFGYITDNFPIPKVILINMCSCTLGYVALIMYGFNYEFNWYLACFMTFCWGI